jgi:hypothetical protein
MPAVREVNLVAGPDLMLRSLCIGGYLSKLLPHGGARSLCGGAHPVCRRALHARPPNAALQFTRVQGVLGGDPAVDLVRPLRPPPKSISSRCTVEPRFTHLISGEIS